MGNNSTLEVMILHFDLHQDHVHDMRPHLKDLLLVYKQTAQKFMATTLTVFRQIWSYYVYHWKDKCYKPNKLVFQSVYSLSKQNWYKFIFKTESLLSYWDGGASILALKMTSYTIIIQIINVCNHDEHDTSKVPTNANQSEVPMKQYIS